MLIDDGSEDQKAKGTKKCVIKRKLTIANYNNCLEATQFENKINYLGKIEIDKDSIKKNHQKFIKNNKLTLETQQRFKSNTHNEEINKIALSSNDDKRMQSINSIETYAYGMSIVLVSEKEEVECKNIIKRYKNN